MGSALWAALALRPPEALANVLPLPPALPLADGSAEGVPCCEPELPSLAVPESLSRGGAVADCEDAGLREVLGEREAEGETRGEGVAAAEREGEGEREGVLLALVQGEGVRERRGVTVVVGRAVRVREGLGDREAERLALGQAVAELQGLCVRETRLEAVALGEEV